MAFGIATEAIARGEDREVEHMQQAFLYLSLMHDENLVSQIAGLALYEGLVSRCDPETLTSEFAQMSMKSTRSHLDVIRRFGRFPSRNKVLGRESTPAEIKYLKEQHVIFGDPNNKIKINVSPTHTHIAVFHRDGLSSA